MRWRLLIKECGPELHYIKGENDIIADTLSRLGLKEEEFSLDSFALDAFPFGPGDQDFPEEYPLSFKQVAHEQKRNAALQAKLVDATSGYKIEKLPHSSHSCDTVVNKDGKIVLPPSLQTHAVEWCHLFLCHPGETCLEFTLRQHHCAIGEDFVPMQCNAPRLAGSARKRRLRRAPNMGNFRQSLSQKRFRGTPFVST